MTLKLKRTPGLYLVGFMCSGKTTVGQALADELGWCFFDLDQEIEKEESLPVATLFAQRGEEAFRQLESNMLGRRVAHIEAGNPCVMALGGGAFVQPRNWDIIENNGVTVWLDCPLDRIEERLGKQDLTRPLSTDRGAMQRLFDARRSLYARADYRVDAGGSDPVQVMHQILTLPIF